MRILHISHTGLPDPRIEKTARTMKKGGHELVFLGGRPTIEQSSAFQEIHYESILSNLRVVLDPRFRKRWKKAIHKIKPDVVHAHNLIVGALMLDMEYPTIYDDHEYWSQQIFKYDAKSLIRRIASKPLANVSPKWEREILERFPTITVSENIAKDHRVYSKDVFVRSRTGSNVGLL
ncbi:MAG: glycosyltransferase family 4 protein [Candidatus Thorarchaeota archaeon]